MDRRDRSLVRPYVVTDGRSQPSRNTFDLVTLVTVAANRPPATAGPEHRRIVELCSHGSLSVAEVAGHLRLPASIVKVLLGDLVDSGHILARAAVPRAWRPEPELLREVLHGLRARL
ncbi:DUF742 domain-containing protein [Streptomyces sp. NPDC048514]|uniref:DUF742 domain-containing protein n=1 Tax=Streptomyces sp. NPDC048514 TaxID=3365564 RepID=UPI003717CE97